MSIDLQKLAAAKKQSLTSRREEVKRRIFKIEEVFNPGNQALAQREIETMKQTVLAAGLKDFDLGKIDKSQFQAIKEEVYRREFDVEKIPLTLTGLRSELSLIEAEEQGFSFIEKDVREYLGLKAKFDPYRKGEFEALAKGLSKAFGVDVMKDAQTVLKQHGLSKT